MYLSGEFGGVGYMTPNFRVKFTWSPGYMKERRRAEGLRLLYRAATKFDGDDLVILGLRACWVMRVCWENLGPLVLEVSSPTSHYGVSRSIEVQVHPAGYGLRI